MIKLTKKQLKEKHAFITKYMGAGNNATLSEANANANVDHKSVATMECEVNTDVHVQMNRYILGEKIKELFGKKVMRQYYDDLKNHVIYKHDESSLKSYCAAISLMPFIYNGATALAGDSKAPEHLASFCGSYVNLMYAIAGQLSGAVAEISLLTYFHYFAKKDFGADYLNTHTKEIENYFQQIVYSVNSPAGARNQQSIFYNTSIFDDGYFESMFGEASYPDGSKPIYKEVNELQKFFLNWFGEERHKALLTFPVITVAYLTENGEPKDKEFNDFVAMQMAKGNSFFHYHSEKATALASCCFDGSQKVLVRRVKYGVTEVTFQELWDARYTSSDINYQVFHNGSWAKGKLVQLDGKQMYKITTTNKKNIIVTEDHLNPSLRGDIPTEQLTTDDYLMFSTRPMQTFPEADKGLTYDEGFLLGMYIGDGSMDTSSDGEEATVHLSLNKDKYTKCLPYMERAVSLIDNGIAIRLGHEYNNVYPVHIGSRRVASFIREYIEGSYAQTKRLNLNSIVQSLDFRKGILDGYYATDGGNSNRIYTTSAGMADDMEALLTSMGIPSTIDMSDRTDEPVVIRGETFKRNYPLYCIRWYSQTNRRNFTDLYKTKNNSQYFKIASIEKIDNTTDKVYCFEMGDNDEPYFTLPNGIITHNCRLRNEVDMNPFAYSLGGTGMMTGSLSVITINMNRLVQKKIDLKKKVQDVHKYLIAFRVLIQEFEKAGLLPIYDAGYIAIDKQYVTVGLNGVLEAAEYLGYDINDNPEYKDWVKSVFKIISDENKLGVKHYTKVLGRPVMINTELIPAENVGVKLSGWDKKAGLKVNRDCYNSYLYRVEDTELDYADKLKLHGGDVLKYLDGGSAVHLNFDEIPNKETWKKIMNRAIFYGSSYWTSNIMSTCCEDCGYIDMNTRQACSKCGSTNIAFATRIIGYLKKIKSFSEARQIEAGKRFYH